jgi:hypothetical protein
LLPVDGSVVIYMIVRGKDGRPTGYPMTGMFQGGQLEITTYRKAHKAQFLLADDRVCCVVADPADTSRGPSRRLRGRHAVWRAGRDRCTRRGEADGSFAAGER